MEKMVQETVDKAMKAKEEGKDGAAPTAAGDGAKDAAASATAAPAAAASPATADTGKTEEKKGDEAKSSTPPSP